MRQSILFEVELYVVLPRFPLVLFDYFVQLLLLFFQSHTCIFIFYILLSVHLP